MTNMVIDSDEIVVTIDGKRAFAMIVIFSAILFVSYTYIGALFAFVAPSETYPLHINSAATYDSSGNAKTSFARGSMVVVNVTLEMATHYYFNTYYYHSFSASTEYLMLVQIMKGSVPVYLGFIAFEIPPAGVQDVGIGFKVSSSAAVGTYKAKIMVWDTLADGGHILADNSGLEITFSVT